MEYPIFFDAKNSLKLFGLKNDFNFLSKLYSNQNLPKVLMLSGNKGSGKSPLLIIFFQFLTQIIMIIKKINYPKIHF